VTTRATALRRVPRFGVQITPPSGVGVLSFDHFRLDLSERVTLVVGPNGAGKSNLTRLLTIC